jgi:hypothetical protein
MPQCLKCNSQNVTSGRVVSYDCGQAAVFRPQGLRFVSLTLTQGPQLADEGFACLDCGLVWSSTAPDKLSTFIRKHCEKGSDKTSA